MDHLLENSYPLELEPVDISPYAKGNTGVAYYTTIDSKKPGPHVAINAVVHGNELCGPIALDFLFRHNVQPMIGRLTLGFANYEAYLSYSPEDPIASRYLEEDLNRVWDDDELEGDRTTLEINRARELRPLIDTIDFLFDIHSMQHPAPALILSGPHAKGREFARGVGMPEYVIADKGHAAGKRLRDYGDFGNPESSKNALLIECGQHWEKSSGDVAIESTLRVLLHLGLLDPEFAAEFLPAGELPEQKFFEVTEAVTVKNSDFHFTEDFTGMEIIPAQGTTIAYDGGVAIKTAYDNCMLVMPNRRLWPGQTGVRLSRSLV